MTHVYSGRGVRVAAALTIGAVLAACSSGTPEEHLARGKTMAAKQDHVGAILEFKNALQGKPTSGEARLLLGRELLAQGDARAAEIELQRLYKSNYNRDAVIPLLVKSQLLQGQGDRIAPELASVELKTPLGNAELKSLLASAANARGKADDALRLYRAAQQYVPDYPDAVLGEARLRALRGELDGASAQIESVLAQNPKNVDALILKGDIAQTRGDMKAAIALYLQATTENPKNVLARQNLASAYVATDALPLAEEHVATLKKLAPRNPGVNYLDALLAYTKKDFLHANDAITRSLSDNPSNGAAQILAGTIALAINQPVQGELHLIEGVRLSQGSVYARRLLAQLYIRQRQPQKAFDVLLPAVRAFPDDPLMNGMAGEIALQQGNFAEASRLFDRAAQLDPNNSSIRVRGAAVALARGDEARGLAALEAAAKTSTDNPSPNIALVIARLNHQQYDQAMVAWQELEKQQPNSPVTYNLRAAIDLGRKDIPGARKALEHALQIQPDFLPVASNLAALDEADGNFDAARQRYRTLLAKDKNNVGALVALATLESRHGGAPESVISLLKEAHRVNPTAEQPTETLVSYFLYRKQPNEALATVQEVLAATPNNIRWLDLLGDLQLQRGGADQAIAAFRQLVQLRPDVPHFQVRLAQAMVLANQTNQALPIFAAALARVPNDATEQRSAVTSLLQADKVDEANRLVAEIRRTSPKSPALVELDGDLKLASKQYNDAVANYRRALAVTPTSDLAVKTALALRLGTGGPASSNAFLGDWLKTHPKDVAARLFDADTALQAKDYAHAAQGYRTVLEDRPNDTLVMNNLAWALWQMKDNEALTVAQKAGNLDPNNPVVNDTLGWILTESGSAPKGIELLQKAAKAAPGQRDIALHLAKAQIKDGRKDEARSTLQALVKSAPTSPEAAESKTLMATL